MCVCVCLYIYIYKTRNTVIDRVYSSLRNVKVVETRIVWTLHVTTIGEKTNINRVLVQPSSALVVPGTELIK